MGSAYSAVYPNIVHLNNLTEVPHQEAIYHKTDDAKRGKNQVFLLWIRKRAGKQADERKRQRGKCRHDDKAAAIPVKVLLVLFKFKVFTSQVHKKRSLADKVAQTVIEPTG